MKLHIGNVLACLAEDKFDPMVPIPVPLLIFVLVVAVPACFAVLFWQKNERLRRVVKKEKRNTEKWKSEQEQLYSVKYDALVAKHSAEMSSTVAQCEKQLRELREGIERRREVLRQKSEKELLIDIMTAIGGYSERIQRVGESIDCLNEADLPKSIGVIKSRVSKLSETIAGIASDLDDVKSVVEDSNSYGSSSWDISDVESEIEDAKRAAEDVKEAVDDIRRTAEYAKEAADDARRAAESAREEIDSLR